MDIINESKILSYRDLSRILSAVNKVLPELCSAWNKPHLQVSFQSRKRNAPSLIISDCKNPPVDGYHSYTDGHALGRVYISSNDFRENSITISHEIFEMVVNPKMELTADKIYLEVCDPVMENSFDVDGIAISDWVYPSWFSKSGIKPFNKLDTFSKPFEITSKGYTLKMNLTSRS